MRELQTSISLKIYNGAGDTANTAVYIVGCVNTTNSKASISIPAGEVREFYLECPIAVGSFKGDITADYLTGTNTYVQAATGSLNARVQ